MVSKLSKRKKKSKIYFGIITQDAILRYNKNTNSVERSKIYNNEIKFAFEKLAENVINTWKFTYFDIDKKSVQVEVVSHMVEKMFMYKQNKGRAYSYFTIIARNWLILENNSNYERWKRNSLLSDMPETWNPPDQFYENEMGNELREFKIKMLEYWDINLRNVFTKKRDLQIADAILELFRRSEYVENFNKKHLYLLIREMTDCKTHYITKVVNVMKTHQKKMLNEYLETGDLKSKNDDFWNNDEY